MCTKNSTHDPSQCSWQISPAKSLCGPCSCTGGESGQKSRASLQRRWRSFLRLLIVLWSRCQGGGGGEGLLGLNLGVEDLWQRTGVLPSPLPLCSHWHHSPGLEVGWISSWEMSSLGFSPSWKLWRTSPAPSLQHQLT